MGKAISIIRTVAAAHDGGAGSLPGTGGMGDTRASAECFGLARKRFARCSWPSAARQLRCENRSKGLASGEAESEIESTEVPSVPPEILIEHLRRENDELKDTVESLRQEVNGYGRRTTVDLVASGSAMRPSCA